MGKLRLGIETSTTEFLVVLTEEQRIVSSISADVRDAMTLDLRAMVRQALHDSRRKLEEITLIVVDRGPGNLSAVRSGVAFANALSSSAGIPVVGANSFDLMYRSSEIKRDLPWLCLRKGSGGHLYAGLISDRQLKIQMYGHPSKISERLKLEGEVVLAGSGENILLPHIVSARISISGITQPTRDGLVNFLCDPGLIESNQFDLVMPITEQADIFNEQS